jgi:hypothetical protein
MAHFFATTTVRAVVWLDQFLRARLMLATNFSIRKRSSRYMNKLTLIVEDNGEGCPDTAGENLGSSLTTIPMATALSLRNRILATSTFTAITIESQLTNSPPYTFMYPMLVARLLNRPVATR